MLRSSLLRALPWLALLVAPLAACNGAVHTVGNDTTDAGSDAGADDCATQAAAVCNGADIPAGCSVGPASCDDGVIHCGQVVCSTTGDGGGDCSTLSSICEGIEIPANCTVGPASCSDGKVTCGAVVCSATGDAGSGVDSGNCEGQVAPPCAAPPEGCDYEGPECVDGHLGCGTLVCADAGVRDAGSPFVCGDTTCDPNSEYCAVFPMCLGTADGGGSGSMTCTPIPAGCSPGDEDICDCILEGYESEHGPESGSVKTNGAECTLVQNCA